MTEVRWKHNFTYLHHKGKVKVVCKPCGTGSRWFEAEDEHALMVKWCNDHSGHREKQFPSREAAVQP